MGRLSNFESRMDRIMDGAAGAVFKAPINPVQITKRAEKEMFKEKLVSAGKQYAPTLYNVLVNPEDDAKLGGFYPTLAGEIETYLKGSASQSGLFMDGTPLVRFIVDPGLRKGKFDIIAENVAAQIVLQLRQEEMERYGLAAPTPAPTPPRRAHAAAPVVAPTPAPVPVAYDPFEEEHDDFSRVPTTRAKAPDQLYNPETGAVYNLSGMHMSIGRDKSNDIAVRDSNVSRSHAELILEGPTWIIRDIGSTNGTFVRGREISEMALRDGDTITVGITNLQFRKG